MVRARTEVLGKYLKEYPGQLRTSVQQVAAISGGGFRNADIQYVIGGPDLDKLTEVFRCVARKDEDDSGRGRRRLDAGYRQAGSCAL